MQGLRQLGRRWRSHFSRFETEDSSSYYGKEYVKRAGSMLLVGATCVVGASVVDDFLVYLHCSRKAIEMAAADSRLKRTLGSMIERAGWWDATIAFDGGGATVCCTIPISGEQGTAKLRLRAVSSEEVGRWNILHAPQDWQILLLEAMIPVKDGDTRELHFINLMDSNGAVKTGT